MSTALHAGRARAQRDLRGLGTRIFQRDWVEAYGVCIPALVLSLARAQWMLEHRNESVNGRWD